MSTDVNHCLNAFTSLFNAAVDTVAPLRDVRVKSRPNPWINSNILAGIKKRDSLLSRFKKDRSNTVIYSEFCRARNYVQREIKLAKRVYFQNKIDENRGDSGKIWRHLKTLGYDSQPSE